jgi:hypothetical protein
MFHACVQRFDGMDEKFLGGKLNRALIRRFFLMFRDLIVEIGNVCTGVKAYAKSNMRRINKKRKRII